MMNFEIGYLRSRYIWLCGAVFLLIALVLFLMDRPLYCSCGYIKFWQSDVFHPQVSKHLTDWYTFTHLTHGFLFYVVLAWFVPGVPFEVRLLLAVGLEGSWEIIENTEYVIEYYRNNTMAVNYGGDTIINSLSDIIAMVLAFNFAERYSIRTTGLAFAGFEVLTLSVIRDSFLLNVLMFVYPIESLIAWQTALI